MSTTTTDLTAAWHDAEQRALKRARLAPTRPNGVRMTETPLAPEWRRREAADGFGATLRRHREAAGLTQPKLAALAGCDHAHISRMESGDREPSRTMVETLADALDLPPMARATLFAAAGYLPDELAALTDAQLALVVATAREMGR